MICYIRLNISIKNLNFKTSAHEKKCIIIIIQNIQLKLQEARSELFI